MSRLIIRGREGERIFEVTKDIVSIGRSEENDVRIYEPDSSRHHCKILRSGPGWKLVDVGSVNGTVVNGARTQWKMLEPGDVIAIGATRIYFDRAPEPEPAPVVPPVVPHVETGVAAPVELAPPPALAAEEIEKYRRLLEINKAINSELDIKKLLERILDAAIAVTGAERGFLLLIEKSGGGGGAGGDTAVVRWSVKAARNLDREAIKRAEAKISKSVLHTVLSQGVSLRVDDAGRDGRFSSAESVVDMNLAAILAAPLRTREGVIGAVYLDHRFRAESFSESHLALLEIVADQAAIAVANARLFEENLAKQEKLRLAQQELEALNASLKEQVASQDAELEEVRGLLESGPRELKYSYDAIVTRSPKMLEIFAVLDRVTDANVPVLVQGESGTGKELIARALHYNGPRKLKPFVAQNCAAIPGPLMESEFFGHVRGAFTGADRDKPGLFELADGGTIFLDEIGDMDLDMQSKLLRVLQGGELRRVGAKDVRKVDVRLISATNRELQALCREGKFREDLYYRIAVINIPLPPLRERREDIPHLVKFFLERAKKRDGGEAREITDAAMRLLTRFWWPGNIRELENEIERALALSADRIDVAQLSPRVQESRAPRPSAAAPGSFETLDLRELVNRAQEDVERRAIEEALRRTKWKKTESAALLGVSRPTLDAKIEKYGLKRD